MAASASMTDMLFLQEYMECQTFLALKRGPSAIYVYRMIMGRHSHAYVVEEKRVIPVRFVPMTGEAMKKREGLS
jgi:hypothetical protein